MPVDVQQMIESFMNSSNWEGWWSSWDAISDAFLEDGDELRAECALWVRDKRRKPILNPTSSHRGWHWSHGDMDSKGLPMHIASSMANLPSWEGLPSALIAYQHLFDIWCLLSHEERNYCWDWEPLNRG